jgi:hypothetical protein
MVKKKRLILLPLLIVAAVVYVTNVTKKTNANNENSDPAFLVDTPGCRISAWPRFDSDTIKLYANMSAAMIRCAPAPHWFPTLHRSSDYSDVKIVPQAGYNVPCITDYLVRADEDNYLFVKLLLAKNAIAARVECTRNYFFISFSLDNKTFL